MFKAIWGTADQQQEVAVKLQKDRVEPDEAHSLLRELDKLRALSNDHIVKCLGGGPLADGRVAIVMELMRQDLYSFLGSQSGWQWSSR